MKALCFLMRIYKHSGFSTVVSGTGKTGFSTGISVKSHLQTSRGSGVYPRKILKSGVFEMAFPAF
jgi:hypothetical protein